MVTWKLYLWLNNLWWLIYHLHTMLLLDAKITGWWKYMNELVLRWTEIMMAEEMQKSKKSLLITSALEEVIWITFLLQLCVQWLQFYLAPVVEMSFPPKPYVSRVVILPSILVIILRLKFLGEIWPVVLGILNRKYFKLVLLISAETRYNSSLHPGRSTEVEIPAYGSSYRTFP